MWNLVTDEWNKIPQDIRFLIEAGAFLVFNSWLLDHWLPNRILPYRYLGIFDLRDISYNLGMSLIFFSAGFIVIRQIWNLPKQIKNYKDSYPTKNLGKTFDLVWFNGKLMLFDHKSKPKQYFHVYPWETAEDLNFTSYGTHAQDNFPNPQNPAVRLDNGKILNTTEYENGGSINTRNARTK